MTVSIPNTRTTMPPEGAEPGPREAVSAKATIVSAAENRRRELVGIIRDLAAKLRAAVLEEAQLRAHLEMAGVVEDGE